MDLGDGYMFIHEPDKGRVGNKSSVVDVIVPIVYICLGLLCFGVACCISPLVGFVLCVVAVGKACES